MQPARGVVLAALVFAAMAAAAKVTPEVKDSKAAVKEAVAKPALRARAAPLIHAVDAGALQPRAQVQVGRAAMGRVQLDRVARMDTQAAARMLSSGAIMSCGKLIEVPNSKPKDYKDARKTKYDKDTKKTVAVTFSAGAVIPFKCAKGFSLDGSKDGETVYDVECLEHGYYKPSKMCVEISACGSLPSFAHAHATGKKVGPSKDNFEYSCDSSYSLDGEKIVKGGNGDNFLFTLKCDELSNLYSKFEGTCSPYSFMAAGEVIKIYNQVFSALFQVSCKGTLKNEFGKLKAPPAGLDKVCQDLSGDCSSIVSAIKADFEGKVKERVDFDKEKQPNWYEEGNGAPNLNDEAAKFCDKLWGLLELPPASA